MRTILICLGLASAQAHAGEPRSLVVPWGVEVRAKPDRTRPAVLRLDPGAEVWETGREGAFTQIRLRRADGWKRGYVLTAELADEQRPAAPVAERTWGFGLMATVSSMRQAARSFQTDDQVNWSTSSYASTSTFPSVYVQYGRRDFFRLSIGPRAIDFTGTASAAVGVANARAVEVKQSIISGRLDKAFDVWRPVYVVGGLEVARASTVTETLGGVIIPTSASDLNTYVGAGAGLGAEFAIGPRFSALVEARAAYFPSVKPPVTSFDASAAAAVWF